MESLDLAELAARATRAAQGWSPGATVHDITVLHGGQSSLTFSALAGDRQIALKVAPPGLAPVRNRDVLRQARAITALGTVPGMKVPAVLFADGGDPPDVPPLFAMS
ncbi:MAG TPA: hypothetical protein PLV68_17125, partial [Ilumatobacteraceae bacterium]|nr:hypothetical protein [Ilumatobacteraceae bacterium]